MGTYARTTAGGRRRAVLTRLGVRVGGESRVGPRKWARTGVVSRVLAALGLAVACVVLLGWAPHTSSAFTVPSVSVPSLTVPTVSIPVGTTPAITTPSVTTPSLSTPTLPTVTVTTATVPRLPVTTPTVSLPKP